MATLGMRIQSIRFSEAIWSEIQEEARRGGVSASQYVREAAIARMYFEQARRGGEEAKAAEDWFRAAREHDAGDDDD